MTKYDMLEFCALLNWMSKLYTVGHQKILGPEIQFARLNNTMGNSIRTKQRWKNAFEKTRQLNTKWNKLLI